MTHMTPKRIIMVIIHQKWRSDNYKNGIFKTATWLASTGINFYISSWVHI